MNAAILTLLGVTGTVLAAGFLVGVRIAWRIQRTAPVAGSEEIGAPW